MQDLLSWSDEVAEEAGTAWVNPQPLPPEGYGYAVAGHLAMVDLLAAALGVEPKPVSEWDGSICPETLDERLRVLLAKLVKKWPPAPDPEPEPGPEWMLRYANGLRAGLADVRDDSRFLREAAEFVEQAAAAHR